jgi:RNA polymerase sigma factor (TIGR02999 family)
VTEAPTHALVNGKGKGRLVESTPRHFSATGADAMSEVTRILSAIDQGDPHAAEQLLPLVYDELRKLAAQRLAQEAPGQTLQATALVHEAYLRLVDAGNARHWDSRGHFFAAAAEAMRRILIDAARAKASHKRGGGVWKRIDLNRADLVSHAAPDDLLTLDDILDKLAHSDTQAAQLVKLRFFAGLSVEQAADLLGLSRSTAYERWAFARAWLYSELQDQPSEKSR